LLLVAEYSLTGIFTSPKEMLPCHKLLAGMY
jgi:hypothetical protein